MCMPKHNARFPARNNKIIVRVLESTRYVGAHSHFFKSKCLRSQGELFLEESLLLLHRPPSYQVSLVQ